MVTMTLNDYLRQFCNYCSEQFEHEPIFNEWDKLQIFAFCSDDCLGAMNTLIDSLNETREPRPRGHLHQFEDVNENIRDENRLIIGEPFKIPLRTEIYLRLAWPIWRLRSRLGYWATGDCQFHCEYDDAGKFIVEVGCPIHDE